jgi:tetratricopeptide (TPR) repeat protein
MDSFTVIGLIHKAIEDERNGRCTKARDKLRQVAALGDSPATLDARLRLGQSLIYGGPEGYAEAEAVLHTARTQAEKAGAPRQQARALHLLALLQWRRHQFDEAERFLSQSPVLQQAASPGPEAGQYFHYRGLVEASRDQLVQAERLYFRALQAYGELGYKGGQAQVCESLAKLLLRQGKPDAALRFALRSLELKRNIDDRYGQAITLSTLGRIYWQQARPDPARQALEDYLALARDMEDLWDAAVVHRTLGEIALHQGRHEEALNHFRDSQRVASDPEGIARARLGEARAQLAAGRAAAKAQ